MNELERIPGPGRGVPVPTGMDGRGMDAFEEESGGIVLKLSELRSMAFRQRYIIGAVVTLALIIGVIWTMLMTPVYEATASVQIDQETSKIIQGQDVDPVASLQDAARYLQTQVDVLNSRSMAQRVIDRLHLTDNDNFMITMSGKPLDPKVPPAQRAQARRDIVLDMLQKNLTATLPISSRVAQIKFSSPNADVAAAVANAYSDSYIMSNISRRFEATAYARTFLQGELERAKERLEDSERAAIDYAKNSQLIDASDAGATSSDDKKAGGSRSLTTASLVQLNDDLSAARTARIEAEQRWRQADSTPLMSMPEVMANPTVQSLQGDRARLQATYEQLTQRYRPDHPEVAQAHAQIAALTSQINRIGTDIRNSIRDKYLLTANQEKSLASNVASLKVDTLAEQQRRVRLDIMSREADTNHSLYDALLQRYKEVSAAAGITSNNVSIVDRAEAPPKPVSPKPFVNLGVAAALGLAVAILLAFGRETFDDSVRSPEDVQRKLQMPLLGTTPVVPGNLHPVEAIKDPRSALSEAYYSIRVALEYSSSGGVPPSLLITSSRPSEGKTTSALAIAQDFARIGRRTLLVDGDLRYPSMHKMIGLTNNEGLLGVMTGQVQIDQVVQAIEGSSLLFLSAGPIPPNPAQLLSGSSFNDFLTDHAHLFDLIVVDGPPIMGLADAPQLARSAAGTVIVVEADRAHRGQAKSAIRRLREAHANILGVILSKFDERNIGYGYGYGYSYAYQYSYAYGPKKLKEGASENADADT